MPPSRRVEATFVLRPATRRIPAVLFVHWLDPGSTSNGRTQFLPDALALARQGVASLARRHAVVGCRTWFRTRDPARTWPCRSSMLKNLARALDVLAALDHVDAARLALRRPRFRRDVRRHARAAAIAGRRRGSTSPAPIATPSGSRSGASSNRRRATRCSPPSRRSTRSSNRRQRRRHPSCSSLPTRTGS